MKTSRSIFGGTSAVLPPVALVAALACACVGSIGDGGDLVAAKGSGDPGIEKACSATYAPGHVSIHRLTNEEYNNTVRDLLHTQTRSADAFDPSSRGLSGFTNDSDGLKISDALVASYYDAAEALAKEVLASKSKSGGAYAQIVTCAPSAACAESTIRALAARAYRRPVTNDELSSLLAVFHSDTDFDLGLQDVITALLVNPKFLFVYVTDPKSRVAGAPFALDAYELAARLSYALWQTMPDDELAKLAESGKLTEPAVLEAQVRRMLKDAKVASLLQSLRNDWAGLSTLADPAGSLVGLDDNVRASMVGEVDAFLRDIVTNDKSLLNVVSGTSSFADETMATYYGVAFTGGDRASFARMNLPPNRRGLVTSAAVLTATAGDVAYTHPVHRGKWITHQVLCTPPPPPPGGLPAVDFDPSQGGTPREKLLAHVKNPACNGCHQVMDTVGLGMENYGPFGKWRDAYPGKAGGVDASGTLPDGVSFTHPVEMFDAIAKDEQTKACLAQQMMAYAVTRAMTSADDRCVGKAIGTASVTPTGTFSDLMIKVVRSRQFSMQTGEAP